MGKSLKFRYKKRDNIPCSDCVDITQTRAEGKPKSNCVRNNPSHAQGRLATPRLSEKEIEKRVDD